MDRNHFALNYQFSFSVNHLTSDANYGGPICIQQEVN